MSVSGLIQSSAFLSFTLLSCVDLTLAQQATMDASFVFRNTAFNSLDRHASFRVLTAGSLGGRVFNDAEQPTDPQGIGGVRVILRSADGEFAGIVGNQISDAAGEYDFSNLRPGKYTVEIDPVSIPAKFRSPTGVLAFEVKTRRRSYVDLAISAQRTITGVVFIDKDGDGSYQAGKDQPVAGACVTAGGALAVSNESGRYILHDLPPGRLGLLVDWPNKSKSTHVVLDLGTGPVTNRVVNVPRNR